MHAYFQNSVIRIWAMRLHDDYNQPLHRFRNVTGDEFKLPPVKRGTFCLGEVQENLGSILAAMFLERTFSPEAKLLGDTIVDGILEAFSTRLDGLDWMTNATKTTAKKKCTWFHAAY